MREQADPASALAGGNLQRRRAQIARPDLTTSPARRWRQSQRTVQCQRRLRRLLVPACSRAIESALEINTLAVEHGPAGPLERTRAGATTPRPVSLASRATMTRTIRGVAPGRHFSAHESAPCAARAECRADRSNHDMAGQDPRPRVHCGPAGMAKSAGCSRLACVAAAVLVRAHQGRRAGGGPREYGRRLQADGD